MTRAPLGALQPLHRGTRGDYALTIFDCLAKVKAFSDKVFYTNRRSFAIQKPHVSPDSVQTNIKGNFGARQYTTKIGRVIPITLRVIIPMEKGDHCRKRLKRRY